jgi:formylglycine-generating enzyme required for sulfatase activity
VTNEQYAEFVKATGARPPRSWGAKAIQTGQTAFVEEQGRLRQEARAAGTPFDPKVFDAGIWWAANWEDAEWEIPQDLLTHPVVYVEYADAQRYARWAGLRLMTEFEYQRAARGDSDRIYPWGDAWDDRKYCQSQHIGKDLSAPVGSFPEGATSGIYDLAGNVWEWTSSPFTAYPGYKALRVVNKKDKRAIECLAPFDANERVAVSGSFQMDKVGVRIPVRRNTDRRQATNAMGFRCAASTTPGLDAARWIAEYDIDRATLGTESELAPQYAATLQRWTSAPGTSELPGYAVIQSYGHVLWCPRENVRANSPSDLNAITTKDGPLLLGFIDVPKPMAQPELDACTYFDAWRGAAKLPEVKAEEQPVPDLTQPAAIPYHQVPGFVADKDCYIFYSRDGQPQVAFPAPPVKAEKMVPGSIANEPFVPPDPATLPKDAPPPRVIDTLRFTIAIPSSTSRAKGMFFDLPILVAPGTYDESWK